MIGNKGNLKSNQVGIKQPFSNLAIGNKASIMMNRVANQRGNNFNPEKGIVNTFNNLDVVNNPITSEPPKMKENKFRIEKQRTEKYKEPYV
jgi:hypothetical protein